MVMISFRTKEDKKHLLEKAKKMEEYASMIVDCIEESEYDERNYRHHEDDDEEYENRYGSRKYRRM